MYGARGNDVTQCTKYMVSHYEQRTASAQSAEVTYRQRTIKPSINNKFIQLITLK